MAEPIGIQQLKDASLDVKSLEEAVNGDENVVVTTRLGETYPSVKSSIKMLFENGGLPAEPFDDVAKMQTDGASLADGDYAIVLNDSTETKNGYYKKVSGVWTQLAYNPQVVSKTYTDAAIDELLNNDAERHYPASEFKLVDGMARDGTVPRGLYPTWRRTEHIRVRAGDTVKVNTSAESVQRLPAMAFFDENGVFVSSVEIPSPTQGYKIFNGIAPVDGYVVAQHASTGFESSYMTINEGLGFFLTNSSLSDATAMQAKAEKSISMNFYDFQNGYVDEDGNEVETDDYMRSIVYQVPAGTTIDIKRLDERFWIAHSIGSTPDNMMQQKLPNGDVFYKQDVLSINIEANKTYIRFFVRSVGQVNPLDFDIKDLYEITTSNDVVYQNDISDLLKLQSKGLSTASKFEVCKGAYSWWNEPQSLQMGKLHPHTFVGAVDIQSGWGKAVKIDTAKEGKHVSSSFLQSSLSYIPDAHNAPVTVVAGDNLVSFYAGHNDKTYLAYRRSTDLNDDNLGNELRIQAPSGKVSYSQAHYNHTNNTLYVAFRAGGNLGGVNHWYLASSTNWSDASPTWQVSEIFKDTEQMYLRLVPTYDGSAFRCLVTKNGRYEAINGLWYASIDLASGEISTGSNAIVGSVGSGAVEFSQLTKIYTATNKIRLYDAKTELTSLPILMGLYETETGGGFYHYLEYDLTTFAIVTDSPIVQSGKSLGGNYYFGGAHFSNVTAFGDGLPQAPTYSNIYTAREADGVSYVEEWKTKDSGKNWTLSRVIDESISDRLWRPRVPFNRDVLPTTPNQIELTWCKGSWTGYTNYNASVWALRK